jgi:hypothetical protein
MRFLGDFQQNLLALITRKPFILGLVGGPTLKSCWVCNRKRKLERGVTGTILSRAHKGTRSKFQRGSSREGMNSGDEIVR